MANGANQNLRRSLDAQDPICSNEHSCGRHGLQDALKRLTAAIRDVESELAAMKAERDPHLCFVPPLSERQRYKKREAPRDECANKLRYCL
jgi:hypothetical protein